MARTKQTARRVLDHMLPTAAAHAAAVLERRRPSIVKRSHVSALQVSQQWKTTRAALDDLARMLRHPVGNLDRAAFDRMTQTLRKYTETIEGLREACELVGFPYVGYKDGNRSDAWAPTGRYKYKRSDHPEMAWVDTAYPNIAHFLGYDFCCAIKAWLKANGHEGKSICQVLLERGSKNVRPANLFYSHTQAVLLRETIKRMREGIEAHKAQLPQPTEEAKALAAEQRARLAELKALIEAAEWGNETRDKLQAEQEELNDAMFPDESHLFFWLGAPPPRPID